MSQAIQACTPLPPSYQGNLQQQASAALASSSSGMPGDSISPVAIGLGVTAGGLLTAVTVTLAVKHFNTSGDKPKPAQAISSTSKPVKREDPAQIKSTRESTQETPSRQPASPPPQNPRQSQSVSSPLQPRTQPPPLISLPLSGLSDPLGSQIADETEQAAAVELPPSRPDSPTPLQSSEQSRTAVLTEVLPDSHRLPITEQAESSSSESIPISPELNRLPPPQRQLTPLPYRRSSLSPRVPTSLPGPALSVVQAAETDPSGSQIPAQAPALIAKKLRHEGIALGKRGLWREAIKVYDELDRRFGQAEDLALRKTVAKALINKGHALGELGLWREAIKVYERLDNRFGKATDTALREFATEARYGKDFALSQRITIPGFPGFIYRSNGVYREENGPCGRCASNTIAYFFGGKDKLITGEAFEKRVPSGRGTRRRQIVAFARENGLHPECYVPRIAGTSISSIDDTEAFIICSLSHAVALVRPEGEKCFYLSDSLDQSKRETYPAVIQEGTECNATDAFIDYQRRNKMIANTIITFHESTSDHSPEPLDEGIIWNEEIKAHVGSPQGEKIWIF